ncbi:flagellar assembly protein FliH [Virgibacillus sp. DJP39]|uniref:flagellar assembly protein FliH n=1 Tax=Virgibacillus sp. DJP39 TaxID=3409790 RepID=UPI003BB697EB
MSNNNLNDIYKQKQIKIKPVELYKKEPVSISPTESIDEQLRAKEQELQELNKKSVQIKQEIEAQLAKTQEKIKVEKEKWDEEKRQLVEETKKQASEEGFLSGKQESLNYYAELLNKATEIVDSASDDYHATIESSEETILKLAVDSAEKILLSELDHKPEKFMHIIKAAIKGIKEQSIVSIYVHPDNYRLVLSQKDELSRLLESDSKLSIYVKDDVTVNSCLIEHPFGQIDASIDIQLKQLRAILHEVYMENR